MMLIRIIALALLTVALSPLTPPVLAEGEVEAFRAAYGRYQAAIEAGDLDTASDAAAEALELGKIILSADSPSLLALYVNYGDLLIDQLRHAEAIPLLAGAVEIFSDHYGRKDERLIYALWALAEANGGVGEHDTAVGQLTRLSGMVRKANGADSRVYADIQQLLGQESYFSKTHYKKARRPLADAYEIYSALYGDSVYQTGLAALWLGKAELMEARRKDQAEGHFLEALQIFEAHTPPGHQLRVAARDLLIHIYEDSGRSDQATGHLVALALMAPQAEIDGEYPQYRKTPDYPRAAARAKKEGWVLLEFTVTTEGMVADPAIVSSEGGEDFEPAALDAIRGYRYAPAVVDGRLIVATGVQSTVAFKLADIKSPDTSRTARRGLAGSRARQY